VRKLGVDVGQARIGLAISQGELVLPLQAIANDSKAVALIAELVAERSLSCIYLGLPLSLSGAHTPSTKNAIELAKQLAGATECELRLIDERLTTKSAQRLLHQAGRDTKSSKSAIDAQSAALILEFALSLERDGELAGLSLEELND
jgi:putative holliday junction resolvase